MIKPEENITVNPGPESTSFGPLCAPLTNLKVPASSAVSNTAGITVEKLKLANMTY